MPLKSNVVKFQKSFTNPYFSILLWPQRRHVGSIFKDFWGQVGIQKGSDESLLALGYKHECTSAQHGQLGPFWVQPGSILAQLGLQMGGPGGVQGGPTNCLLGFMLGLGAQDGPRPLQEPPR